MSAFERAVKEVLRHEGGYVNDPVDPGGETNYGISTRSYPDLDIKALTLAEAREIYRRDYWQRARCDDLPAAVALVVFDTAVNMGVGTAVRLLQRVLRLAADGIVGPETINAAQAMTTDHLEEYLARRACRYAEIPAFSQFGLGWMRRVLSVYRAALDGPHTLR